MTTGLGGMLLWWPGVDSRFRGNDGEVVWGMTMEWGGDGDDGRANMAAGVGRDG